MKWMAILVLAIAIAAAIVAALPLAAGRGDDWAAGVPDRAADRGR
jgi:hypothetical protein